MNLLHDAAHELLSMEKKEKSTQQSARLDQLVHQLEEVIASQANTISELTTKLQMMNSQPVYAHPVKSQIGQKYVDITVPYFIPRDALLILATPFGWINIKASSDMSTGEVFRVIVTP